MRRVPGNLFSESFWLYLLSNGRPERPTPRQQQTFSLNPNRIPRRSTVAKHKINTQILKNIGDSGFINGSPQKKNKTGPVQVKSCKFNDLSDFFFISGSSERYHALRIIQHPKGPCDLGDSEKERTFLCLRRYTGQMAESADEYKRKKPINRYSKNRF